MNPILTFIGNILTGGGVVTEVVKTGAAFVKGKIETKRVAVEADNRIRQELLRQGGSWDEIHAQNSGNSWKDEFWTCILAIPIFMVGYAIIVNDMSVIHRVEQAFAALNDLPEWYQYLLFIAISSSFGIKGASKLMNMRK